MKIKTEFVRYNIQLKGQSKGYRAVVWPNGVRQRMRRVGFNDREYNTDCPICIDEDCHNPKGWIYAESLDELKRKVAQHWETYHLTT